MWVGRDLGYRGGRRTGIALTDEVNLPVLAGRLGIKGLQKATRSEVVAERTAGDVWRAVDRLPEVPVFWNAFPFHPHIGDVPNSNRKHTSAEAAATESVLDEFLSMFSPMRLLALGNDSYASLTRLGRTPVLVRHPSYGGQQQFHAGIEEAYRQK